MSKKILTIESILHLARLSKLKLTEEEIKKYESQLGETIDFIKNLDELDTNSVSPTNSVVDLKNVFFEDGSVNEKPLSSQEATSNAKKIKDHKFVVDRIMQE